MYIPEYLKKILNYKKKISFAEYMNYALYDPQNGYYTTKQSILGRDGDFFTGPELTNLYGACIAESIVEIFQNLVDPVILEIGAGSGKLSVDILNVLQIKNAIPNKYYILEVSGSLRKQQEEYIKKHCPWALTRVQWLQSLPDERFNGIIIANEVLDAMPCERLMRFDNKIYKSFIEFVDNKLQEIFTLCDDKKLIQYGKYLPEREGGYITEYNNWLASWLQALYDVLKDGVVLLIDYGYGRNEYLHQDRFMGTLMCHFNQTTNTDPFMNIGNQDITSHVDFTLAAEEASNVGFNVSGYTTQACFLLGCNILEKLSIISDGNEKIKQSQLIKILLQPHEMGDIFKFMLLTKNFDHNVLGFNFLDKRGSL